MRLPFAEVEKIQEEQAGVRRELGVWFGHIKVDKIYNYLNVDGKQAVEQGAWSPERRLRIGIVIFLCLKGKENHQKEETKLS